MGLYNSKMDFDIIVKHFPWLTENHWIEYYRDIIDDKDGFSIFQIKNMNIKFKLWER